MLTETILRYGTQVLLTNVDRYGFCGRDNHPSVEDVGFLGIIVGNVVSMNDEDGMTFNTRENVLGGIEFPNDAEGDYAWICYKVRAADGRERELMSHEIEVI